VWRIADDRADFVAGEAPVGCDIENPGAYVMSQSTGADQLRAGGEEPKCGVPVAAQRRLHELRSVGRRVEQFVGQPGPRARQKSVQPVAHTRRRRDGE
jgi:hypothetical protein